MSKEIKVYSPTKDYIRTYSEKVHGKGYMKLAKEFASKVEGRTLAEDGKIKEVKKEVKKEDKQPEGGEGKEAVKAPEPKKEEKKKK